MQIETIYFTIAIQDAVWKSSPITKIKLIGLNYPKEIRDMIAEKRKLRGLWYQTLAS